MAANKEKKQTPGVKRKTGKSSRKSKEAKSFCVECSWFLDKTRMVTVTKREGKSFILLRELGGCVFKPRNKGIVLTTKEWKELTKHMEEIDKVLRYKNYCKAQRSRGKRH